MINKFLALVTLGLTLFVPHLAHAQAKFLPCRITGCYIRGSGSLDRHRDFAIKNTSAEENINPKTGWDVAAGTGIIIDLWRFEFEVAYRTNGIDNINESATSTSGAGKGGHISHLPVMLNFFYDIPLCEPLSLYLGSGAGIDFRNLKINTYATPTIFQKTDEDDTCFAWQFMAGFSYELSEKTVLFIGYHFFATTEPDKFKRTIDGTSLITSYNGLPFSHSIETGIRFSF